LRFEGIEQPCGVPEPQPQPQPEAAPEPEPEPQFMMRHPPHRHPGEGRDPVPLISGSSEAEGRWIPAFAGMTVRISGEGSGISAEKPRAFAGMMKCRESQECL
jgi:hypothetical protein